MNLFRSSSLRGRGDSVFHLSEYQQSSSKCHQTQISNNGMIEQRSPRLHQVSISQWERPGPAGMPGVFSCASLSEMEISKDRRPRKICIASYASTQSLSVESYLYSLYYVSSYMSWLSKTPCESVSYDTPDPSTSKNRKKKGSKMPSPRQDMAIEIMTL